MRSQKPLTIHRLKELYRYDQSSGLLEVLKTYRGCKNPAGALIAGGETAYGYRTLTIDGYRYLVHRLAWLYVYGRWPAHDIDHINGVRGDNRISNLREATRTQNLQNERKARRSNKSTGMLGASWDDRHKKYRAQIRLNGRKKHLGYFSKAEEAHAAYVSAKRELHTFCTI